MYVPLKGHNELSPGDDPHPRGIVVPTLWSTLARGGLLGDYYKDLGSNAVWTATDPRECMNYTTFAHLGTGVWFRVMVHMSKAQIESSGLTTGTQLGKSKHQIAILADFVPICGISVQFKSHRMLLDDQEYLQMLPYCTSPNEYVANTWDAIAETHPADIDTFIKLRVTPPDRSLRTPMYLGDVRPGATDDMDVDPEVVDMAAESAAPEQASASATKVDPENVPWFPKTPLEQDSALLKYRYPPLNDLTANNETQRLLVRPAFEAPPVLPGEKNAYGLPNIVPMDVIPANRFGETWDRWRSMFRALSNVRVSGRCSSVGFDSEGKYSGEQEKAFRDTLSQKKWNIQQCLAILEALSPMTALRVAVTYAYGGPPPLVGGGGEPSCSVRMAWKSPQRPTSRMMLLLWPSLASPPLDPRRPQEV